MFGKLLSIALLGAALFGGAMWGDRFAHPPQEVQALQSELREDSLSLTDALVIWHKLITITDPSPRNLKAFLNRLRYFASRYSGAVDSQHEVQLVTPKTDNYQ